MFGGPRWRNAGEGFCLLLYSSGYSSHQLADRSEALEYIVLIRNNATSPASSNEWDGFFDRAKSSGMFKGGSALGSAFVMGKEVDEQASSMLGGFMRFDSESTTELKALLETHPVVQAGGSIEVVEMPVTS